MESSRDRVLKALEHLQPEQTPVHIMGIEGIEKWLRTFKVEDYFELRQKLGLDLQAAWPIYTGFNAKPGGSIWGVEHDISKYVDDGCNKTRGGYPLANASSVADLERFHWPHTDAFDYDIVAEVLKMVPDKARWVKAQYALQRENGTKWEAARGGGQWLPVLCSLFDLFGLEETLMKLHTNSKLIEAAIAHLEEFILEFTRRLLEATRGLVDIYWYGDDFAGQTGMMISPEHWRKFLKPTYQRIFQLAKTYDVKVWFHGCGSFRPVMPDLIEIGMDVWETVQVHLPGNEPEVLKREFGQDIAFYGAINTQRTLPFGTPEEVRSEVRQRIRVLGKGGGYICGGDHSILPEVPIENVLAMLDEARRFNP